MNDIIKDDLPIVKDENVFMDASTGEILTYIRVRTKECKTLEGKTFYAYKGILKGGRFIDLVFTKDSGFEENQETTNFVLFPVEWGVDKNRLYPKLYVKSYKAILPYEVAKDVFTI